MKRASTFLFVLEALPLIIYPVVLLADLMTFSGHVTGGESPGLLITVYAFVFGSMVYPVVYVACVILAYARMRENKLPAAMRFSVAPLAYLALLVALIVLWVELDS